ncbi:MAG: DUF1501 domain-containing protein [Acidobacteriia bacterium]|nr:DUF1501 domain-containing protein [Terriglobia bacterium]MYG00899.1 DUF1501 domain-containing protein [Terriglobia bacterium]MYK11730.1 DUF1501 domain-containing protein [Terriglobia bacterium]
MNERERFDKIVQRRQPTHHSFFERPHSTRRHFFRDTLTGVGGFFLADRLAQGETETLGSVQPQNTAKSVIFIFMRGAPSHVDTFDFKSLPGVTPSNFEPESFMDGAVTLPMTLLGNTSRVLDKIAIIRSGLAWARAHPLAQTWMQIGRNPTSPTGRIAPHIGSVVAIEKDPERRPDQAFPTFISLQARNISGAGYFPVEYGPFQTYANSGGLASASHPTGEEAFQNRWDLLQQIDSELRGENSPFGPKASGMGSLYLGAKRLMFNPSVDAAFSFTNEERVRYGSTGFGDAVLTARKIVEQDQGTRFIQIDSPGWDHHGDIYNLENNPNANNIYGRMAQFDPAFAALIEDLDSSGKLDETLILACGEFGRTPGPLSNERNGRDHYLQMFFVLAGGGVQGGKVIGATSDEGGRGPGAFTTEYGWSRQRDIRPEDIEATIYSAMGIDWTTVRYDDPLDRGFYYVPVADDDAYAPVDELWA